MYSESSKNLPPASLLACRMQARWRPTRLLQLGRRYAMAAAAPAVRWRCRRAWNLALPCLLLQPRPLWSAQGGAGGGSVGLISNLRRQACLRLGLQEFHAGFGIVDGWRGVRAMRLAALRASSQACAGRPRGRARHRCEATHARLDVPPRCACAHAALRRPWAAATCGSPSASPRTAARRWTSSHTCWAWWVGGGAPGSPLAACRALSGAARRRWPGQPVCLPAGGFTRVLGVTW